MKRRWILAIAAGALAMNTDLMPQTRPSTSGASADTTLRILVSVRARRLWVLSGASDTLLTASVAVGSGKTLRSLNQTWTFDTPRGVYTVLSKEENPVWVRPDWSYVEAARRHGLRLARVDASKPLTLRDGRVLAIRENVVGVIDTAGQFTPLPTDEEVVFDGVLYIPPIETQNRRVPGQLGRYRLNLGNGIGLHGTPDSASVGRAVTHGCMRLFDADVEWLYSNIPIGTHVYLY
ncbi:MAG TPA: L,D-transpeptidase [Gemmatimonadaceae bacterium]